MKKRRIINENPTPIEELLRRNGALIDESVEEGFVEIICSDGSVMRVGADFNMFDFYSEAIIQD